MHNLQKKIIFYPSYLYFENISLVHMYYKFLHFSAIIISDYINCFFAVFKYTSFA